MTLYTIITFTAVLSYVLAAISIDDIKHIEVENINKLTFKERSSIFEPTSYLSSSKKTSRHNVNIFDKFGKFIRLNYYSQYGDHIDIFELKPNGLNDIKSVQCINDETNTIRIQFLSKHTASKYASTITSHLENDPASNKYFVTGSHEWKCPHLQQCQRDFAL